MSLLQLESSSDDSDTEPDDINGKLLWAAQKGEVSLIQKILQDNPEAISFKDEDGYTALHRASYEGKVEAVKVLLSHRADINAKTKDGWTPLHSACRWNKTEVSSVLLKNGADVNCLSNGHQTPLHLAANNKGAKNLLVLLLSQNDIKPEVKNSVGETAYDIARRTDKHHILFNMVKPHVTEYC